MRPKNIREEGLAAKASLRRYDDIRDLIANPENPTPLLRVKRLLPEGPFELFLKLEWWNPFGSIKDRAVEYMLKGMEERGELDGKQLVEPTSGNTGIAMAAFAALLGKKIVITIPDGVPDEKKILLRMLGAEVWPTPDDLCPVNHPKDGAIALAHSFVNGKSNNGRFVMPNQYENQDNVKAHYQNTGPEIWKQTEGKVSYFFAGFGTCGTLTGVGKFLKERNPAVKVIAVEPQKGHRIPGLKNFDESKPPPILDRSLIDQVIMINDEKAYNMTKRLFRKEGLIVGPSTGAVVCAALEMAEKSEGVAVAISPDSGFKYASFFADVLGDEGKPSI